MALLPVRRVEQRLDDASLQKPGGCVGARRLVIYARQRRAAKHHFSGQPEIFSCWNSPIPCEKMENA
jgi:hypothetical protein